MNIVHIDRARQELEKASTTDEVKDIADKWAAIKSYLKKSKAAFGLQQQAAEMTVRAKRKMGLLLLAMDRDPGGHNSLFQDGTGRTKYTTAIREIGKTNVYRSQCLARIPDPVFEAHISIMKAEGKIINESGLYKIEKRLRQDEKKTDTPALPVDGRFGLIYADPPWRYEHSKTTNRDIENHYPTMTLSEILHMKVHDITQDDCILYLWATSPKLQEAMQVIAMWGFTYRTCLVWDKEIIGMGYYARQQHELLLIATKGKPGAPPVEARVSSVYRERRNRHSKKPEYFYSLIESCYPDKSKIELFARNSRDGWFGWGNEA